MVLIGASKDLDNGRALDFAEDEGHSDAAAILSGGNVAFLVFLCIHHIFFAYWHLVNVLMLMCLQ